MSAGKQAPGLEAYEALKREARELQRAIKRSLAECRDRIAYREGFKNWAQMDAVIAKATGVSP